MANRALDVVDLSAQLGDKEKVIAEYWADGSTTVTPPGHWNVFAQDISRRDKHSLDQDIKFFFILENALMDVSIATWDVKRCTDSVRPVTVIRALLVAAGKSWRGLDQGLVSERFTAEISEAIYQPHPSEATFQVIADSAPPPLRFCSDSPATTTSVNP